MDGRDDGQEEKHMQKRLAVAVLGSGEHTQWGGTCGAVMSALHYSLPTSLIGEIR